MADKGSSTDFMELLTRKPENFRNSFGPPADEQPSRPLKSDFGQSAAPPPVPQPAPQDANTLQRYETNFKGPLLDAMVKLDELGVSLKGSSQSMVALLEGKFGEPGVADYAFVAETLFKEIHEGYAKQERKAGFGEDAAPLIERYADRIRDTENALTHIVSDVRAEFFRQHPEKHIDPDKDISRTQYSYVQGLYDSSPKLLRKDVPDNHPGYLTASVVEIYGPETSFAKAVPAYREAVKGYVEHLEERRAQWKELAADGEISAEDMYSMTEGMAHPVMPSADALDHPESANPGILMRLDHF